MTLAKKLSDISEKADNLGIEILLFEVGNMIKDIGGTHKKVDDVKKVWIVKKEEFLLLIKDIESELNNYELPV